MRDIIMIQNHEIIHDGFFPPRMDDIVGACHGKLMTFVCCILH